MHFICVSLIKYGNGKLSQSEISRCSHLEFNRRVLVWGQRVGGRWEIFHTFSYLPSNKCIALVSTEEPYVWWTWKFWKQQSKWEKWAVSFTVWLQNGGPWRISLNHITDDSLTPAKAAPCIMSPSWTKYGIFSHVTNILNPIKCWEKSVAKGSKIEVSLALLFKNKLVKEKERH